MSTRRHFLAAAFGLGLAGPLLAPAQAQTWPNRPVTIIVPFAPGGPTDVSARIVAEHMSRSLSARVIIENVGGAGGATGAARARNAAPDGYTLLVGNLGAMAANVALSANLPYDPIRDFEPIGMINLSPMVVVTRPRLPVNALGEFGALLQREGDRISYGSGGVGATSHLACLFLESQLGTARGTHVPYRGTAPALSDVMADKVDYLCDQATIIVPQVQAGTVKPLVVSSERRLKLIPDVPSAAEAGVPGYIMSGWNGLFAPKGTPEPILTAARGALAAAHRDEMVLQRFDEVASEVPAPELLTADGLRQFVAAEIERWVAVVRAANIQPQ